MNFHKKEIKKGIYGDLSKVKEEIEEYEDAISQNCKIMSDLELADIYGALEGLANSHNLSMADLKSMSDLTKKARFSKKEHLDLSHKDLSLLTESVKFVIEEYGFIEYAKLPWHVSNLAIKMTTNVKPHKTMDGNFIGSAEQAFVELMLNNKLDKESRYVAISPCLRNDNIDDIHDRQFYKAELFSCSESYDYRDDFVKIAKSFMKKFINNDSKIVEQVVDDDQTDLLINNIEVGSYVSKSYNGKKWTCGTLIAVPRFSIAISKEI
jgi:hypothetical protein